MDFEVVMKDGTGHEHFSPKLIKAFQDAINQCTAIDKEIRQIDFAYRKQ